MSATLMYAAYWVLIILAPGMIVWGVLWTRISPRGASVTDGSTLERVVCGAAVGYVLELPAYALARALGDPRGYVLLQVLILAVWLVLAVRQRQLRVGTLVLATQAGVKGSSAWASITFAAALAYTAVWLGIRAFPSASLSPNGRFADPDDPFQLSLIGELRHHFPAVYPFAADEPLNYQLSYHLHAAASTWITGLTPLEVFTRFDPLMFALLSLAGAGCLAQRLSRNVWAAPMAAGILTLVGSFDVTGLLRGEATFEDRFLSPLLIHSPTQAMAFALVTPLALISVAAVAAGRVSVVGVGAFFALAVTMTLTKVTFVPMLVAALVAVALCGWILRRSLNSGALLLAGSGAIAVALCVVLVFGTGGRGLALDPLSVALWYGGGFSIEHGTIANDALIVLLAFSGALVPVAGIAPAITRLHAEPALWLLLLSGLAGLGACAVLGHGGLSQRYFFYSSSWFFAVAAAWGLTALLAAAPPSAIRGYIALALAAGGVLFALRLAAESKAEMRPAVGGTFVRPGFPGWLGLIFLIIVVILIVAVVRVRGQSAAALGVVTIFLTGLGLARTFAFAVGDVEPLVLEPPSASPGALRILDWLRENSSPEDLVMTNAHCVENSDDATRCDNRHFWMSAISQRRFVLEGWGYIEHLAADSYAPYGGDPRFLADNDAQFTRPTARGLETFKRETGVDFMLVDRRLSADLDGLTRLANVAVVLQFEDYALLSLADSPEVH